MGTIDRASGSWRPRRGSRRPRAGRAAAVAALALAVVAAVSACEPVPTTPGTDRVVVFGDSVPNGVIDGGRATADLSAFTLVNATILACDGADRPPPVRSRTGAVLDVSAVCAQGWRKWFPPHVTIRPHVAVLMTGQHAMLDHYIDGAWRHPCHAPAREWYEADIHKRLAYLVGHADRTVLVLPADPGDNSGWIVPADHTKRASCVRDAMRRAAEGTGATVIDLATYLCPGGTCEPWRTKDGIHVDADRTETVLTWLLDEVDPGAPTAPAPLPS
jgi:hypothetical protein